MKRLILASASPRRKEILSLVGINFKVCSSDKEEIITKTKPEDIVSELSYMKAMDICNRTEENGLIIGADTMVAIDGQVLGKPKNREGYNKESIRQRQIIDLLKKRKEEEFFKKGISIKE